MATKAEEKTLRTTESSTNTKEEARSLTQEELAEFIDSLEPTDARVETEVSAKYDDEKIEDRLSDIVMTSGTVKGCDVLTVKLSNATPSQIRWLL